MQTRANLFCSIGLAIVGFSLLVHIYGYDKTWQLWNIPTLSPHFADLRVITAGSESYAKGHDPMINNPADPWGRPLNYPRVWQSLYLLGINQSHTTCLGISLIFLFVLGL